MNALNEPTQERIACLELFAVLANHLVAAKRREMKTLEGYSSHDPVHRARLTRTLVLDTGVRTGKSHIAYSLCGDKSRIVTLTDGHCEQAPAGLRNKILTLRSVLRDATCLHGVEMLIIDNASLMPRINIDSLYRLAVRINPDMFFVFLESPSIYV